LSYGLKIPFSEVKAWLENETGSVLTPVHVKAQKLLNEMSKALGDLVDASEMLLENSRKEIEKRNMRTFGRAKALNKLAKLFLERFQQIKVPEKPSYREFEEFVKNAREAFGVTDIDVRNWFPRISPFFILDRGKFARVFEKAKESLKELNDFLTKEYVKTKILEDTFRLIEDIGTLEAQLTALNNQMKKIEDERAKFERETVEVQQKMAGLIEKAELSQLKEIDVEMENLRREVESHLRHLQKPFVKLQSLALHGEGSGLTPEELKKLNQYLADPFEAFSTEDADYPILRQILRKVLGLMSNGKLKLKQDKERKAKQAIEEILKGNSLASLHKKCVDARLQKNQLSTSAALMETRTELSKLQENFERLKKKREALESEGYMMERSYRETLGKIQNYKGQIEKNIFDFTGKKVKIE
jgi:predicted  nucleic acid-binding Zn-ribbon protein